MNTAMDRFVLPDSLEREAQEIAAQLGMFWGYPMLLGYLGESVAHALERPRWRNRDRLRIDLRVVQIILSRTDPPPQPRPTIPTGPGKESVSARP